MTGRVRRTTGDRTELETARYERWWLSRPPLRTIDEARAYLHDLGFSLLFGGGARYPSLREASRDESLPRQPSGWADDIEAMWTWKDTLPVLGDAWLGRYLSGKQTLVSTRLLADLYEYAGDEDDAVGAPGLTPGARAVAEMLWREGPTPTRTIRAVTGLAGKQFDAALAELGRRLLVTNYGVEDGPGWASCVLELTARVFPVPGPGSRAERDARAAGCFLDTMVRARPIELSRAFGWIPGRAATAMATTTASNADAPIPAS
jgi:hypothetical protein